MARPPKFSNQEILDVGKQLMDEGEDVTAHKIIAKLGGGNYDRINSVWNAYFAGIKSPHIHVEEPNGLTNDCVADAKIHEIVQELGQRITKLVNEVLAHSSLASDRFVREFTASIVKQKLSENQELHEARQLISDLQQQVLQASIENEQVVTSAHNTIAVLEGKLSELESQFTQSELSHYLSMLELSRALENQQEDTQLVQMECISLRHENEFLRHHNAHTHKFCSIEVISNHSIQPTN